ncbi:SMP-30/gluconolactonase/LRE family protein [Brucella pecoris]|uniref:SMP-30/gluconolactonase/LRE family protein n=1 Tax=Brucella pecoris TaxID=867683 RepID=A0A5C5CJM8_9HYPH|nr:SMP-30/gluconolactonase/LRE family protein [Brucella pecoris]MBB4091599.1 sugar lactone lactonase YvrE [Brucella pecoris]TNV11689.1 SMP-30/gluconolactonase/LRE family protein [Brucella pecoris]
MMGPFRCIADLRGQLMESPVWDDRRRTLFVCDIYGRRIYEIDIDADIDTGRGVLREWTFVSQVASLGLTESGRLVVALSRQLVLFDPETGSQEPLWSAYDEPATSRLNDGKVGPDGAFWIGSMDGRPQRETISRLYRVTGDGNASVKAEGFEISNGLAWTADGRTMFHTDSRGPWIDRYNFDPESGNISGRKRICDLDELSGRPDGGACDAEGAYWSAGVSAGVLNRFDREGNLLEKVPVPVPAPTMPCFCGSDLTLLAITSHRQLPEATLETAPRSGGVFLAQASVAGAPVTRMKGV